MKQAIIFGGAFNPPSRGHVWILSHCADIARATGAEIWVVPSGERRDKQIGVTRDVRIKLCDAMVKDANTRDVVVRVMTSELDRTETTETVDTVRELAETYPDYHFRWVFGADSYATMASWGEGEWLLANLDMLIVTRGNHTVLTRDNVHVIDSFSDDVSSTQIRHAQARGEHTDELVTPHVQHLLRSGQIQYT